MANTIKPTEPATFGSPGRRSLVSSSPDKPASSAWAASSAAALAHRLAATSLDEPLEGQVDGIAPATDLEESVARTLSARELYLDPTPASFAQLVSSLRTRLENGMGESLLELGIEDDGTPMDLTPTDLAICVATLTRAANDINADVTVLNEHAVTKGHPLSATESSDEASTASSFVRAHILVRRRPGKVEDLLELRISVVGNVDAGKSTLLGVLTKNVLDDGRGKARLNLFRHKHEVESGRTSSVGLEIIGFTSKAEIVTPALLGKIKLGWDDICESATKVLTFMDLAGHEKYLKTTVFGLTGTSPDFVMLMIGSNAGIIGMTKEHLGLALALQVPVFIVVTKIDMCPDNVLASTISQLTKILKSSGCRKIPIFLNTTEDVLTTAGNFVSERVCPIFQVSNVTGAGLDLLKLFLNVLHANTLGKYDASQPTEYDITDTFSVPGVGTVVSGTIITGVVHVGDQLLLGPDSTGAFAPTIIKSIQRKRTGVPVAFAGQSASFALKKVKRSAIRKGMVMLSKSLDPKAVYEFEAEILVLYHSTTISQKYQAMLHCGCVRQTAKIIGMDRQVLRTGDRAFVRFRFIQHPEYLKLGTRLLFREGRTKGVGKVTRVFTDSEIAAANKAADLAAGVHDQRASAAASAHHHPHQHPKSGQGRVNANNSLGHHASNTAVGSAASKA
ncbi:Short integuments 2, mitochondrial [Geranomyces variabilis]|nr:Short integuments 2, mitochondrial [Geranomyces variabilis]